MEPINLFNQLFTWDELEQMEDDSFEATGCTLAVPIGPHQAGKSFDQIIVSLESSEIILQELNSEYDEDDDDSEQFVEVYRTALKLSVA